MIPIPHLETDITQACQLSCVGCNHSVPLWRKVKGGPWLADPRQVEKDLNHLSTMVHADRWGALGGEPLLSNRLIDILKVARSSGVADKLEVWTNGILLPRQSEEFWKSFDILVLSVYAGKHTKASLAWIKEQCEATGVELVVKDETRQANFMTLFEPVETNAPVTKDKFDRCFFRQFSRVANYGFFFTCCCAPHLPMLVKGQPYGTDGIAIDGLTEEALKAYLERSEPLGVCTICAGRDTALPLVWQEEKDPVAWMQKSGGQHASLC